jgi:hypothetical protein
MDDVGDDLSGLDNSYSRAIEVEIAVRENHFAFPDGAKFRPAWVTFHHRDFLQGAR